MSKNEKKQTKEQMTREQDTMNEDPKEMGLEWKDAKSVDGNLAKWKTLVAQCSRGKKRNQVQVASYFILLVFITTVIRI